MSESSSMGFSTGRYWLDQLEAYLELLLFAKSVHVSVIILVARVRHKDIAIRCIAPRQVHSNWLSCCDHIFLVLSRHLKHCSRRRATQESKVEL